MHLIKYMKNIFNHKLALITFDGKCSSNINGIMRKDETAAVIFPKHELELKEACKLRYYLTTLETLEYAIKGYYRDTLRPLSRGLIKPIVIELSKSVD